MGVLSVTRHAFNRGILSALGLARTDIEKLRLAAETMTNWMPRVLGSMTLRPGLGYIGSTRDNAYARHLPFVKSTTDTALIELTDSAMRVRVGDEIIARQAVSTSIRGGDFAADITHWNKQSNPSSLPASDGKGVAFSPDGQLMAVAHTTSPYLTIYAVSGTTFTNLNFSDIGFPGNATGVAFSPDGNFLAVTHAFSPYVRVYVITGTGGSATFDLISSAIDDPTGTGRGVAFSPDSSLMAIAHDTSPYVTIYTMPVPGPPPLTICPVKIADPGTLPAGNANGVSFSSDGQLLAVAHATTPFITIYSISGTTFTKITNPGTLPAGTGNGVAFSRSVKYMAVAHATTPFVTVYSISGTTFTKLTNPGTLPASTGRGVSFSSDNQNLAVAHDTTPYVSVYQFTSATALTYQTAPGTTPAGNGGGLRFSPDNRWLAVAHTTSPYVTIYEAYQWLDIDDSGATSTYQGGSLTIPTVGPLTLSGSNPGWVPVTIRHVIDAAHVLVSGSSVQLVFKAAAADTFTITKCYIGHAAASGDAYDFDSATVVTFSSGSAGFTISNGATITSDVIAFQLDATRDLVVSYYMPTADGMATTTGSAGWSVFYKSGDDASTLNTGGYTDYTAIQSSLGLQAVYVAGATSDGAALSLVGTGYAAARRVQAVSVALADEAIEHALGITVSRGIVKVKVGTSYGLDDLVAEAALTEGRHSLAFTPNSSLFFIQVSSATKYATLLDSLQIEAAGDMVLSTPWAMADLAYVRYSQSADVVFCARYGIQQRRIERRAARSWSIVKYYTTSGPYRVENTDDLVTMTASALSGDITVTASLPFFRSTHVGSIMQLTSVGQSVSQNVTAAGQWTSPIKVTGVGDTRAITVTRTGTFSGTVTLQKSLSAPGNWVDVTTYTTAAASSYNDGLDNQVIYYRVGIDTGDYTSGSVVVKIDYDQGQIKGVVRFTGYTSSTVMSAIVLTDLGGTDATEVWAEGLWSDYRGWPSAVDFYEGRIWWAGKDKIVGSVSDAFDNFDPATEGDSGPINRSIGDGPVDTINWLVAGQRQLIGGEGEERAARSSSFDEPLTPTNFNLKSPSSVGSGAVAAVKIDSKAIFVSRTLTRLFEMAYDSSVYDYATTELTLTVPDLCGAQIATIAWQRYPDIRIHCVLDDGTAAVLVYDRAEKVLCWLKVETPGADGLIEDVAVLPGTPEDTVYYTVNRTIGGSTVRYLERWAMETECVGGTLNKQADSFVTFTNDPASATIAVGAHLIGESVVVWADGKCLDDAAGEIATFIVDGSGNITVTDGGDPYLATTGVVGLAYTAPFESGKLAVSLGGGPGLNIRKKLVGLGLCLYKTHARGLKYGDDFTHMRSLPTVEAGKPVDADAIWDSYDFDLFGTGGSWSTDSRLCLQAQAPRPATVLAATMAVDSSG